LWTSTEHGGPTGFGLELPVAYALAAVVTLVFIGWSVWRGLRFAKDGNVELEAPAELETPLDGTPPETVVRNIAEEK